MLEKGKKGRVTKIFVFITSIFVIFISISYAFVNPTLFGIKKQVITTGSLELKLTEGNEIQIENALPVYDEVGMIQKPFEFQLINKINDNLDYTLKLVDMAPEDLNKLDPSFIKYGLERDGTRKIGWLSSLIDGSLDYGTIAGNQAISYSLRLWIDFDVEDENLINGKSLSYRIDVQVGQEIPVDYKRMMKKSSYMGNSSNPEPICSSPENYCPYMYQIHTLIFENSIHVPEEISDDKKWDLSVLDDGSVMGYVEENESGYILHIQGNGKIYANVDSSGMLRGLQALEKVEGLEYLDTSQVVNMSAMFITNIDFPLHVDVKNFAPFDFSMFDTSKVTNMSSLFRGYKQDIPIDLSKLDTSKVTDMNDMFREYRSNHPLDLSHFDTSNVTNMSSMFYDYSNSYPLDLSNFNTSNVTTMSHLFYNCQSTQLSGFNYFDTSKVADMSFMFASSSNTYPLDLSHFDTSNVTNMSHMFYRSNSSQILGLSHFNTSKVTNMMFMFASYSSDYPIDLSHFDTLKVTNMSFMFYWCDAHLLGLNHLNTSNVTDMSGMFSNYGDNQPLDLSNFDTSNVVNMSQMFSFYHSEQVLNFSSFDTSNVTNMTQMFYNYKSSQPLDISNFDLSKLTESRDIFFRLNSYSSSPILVRDETMKAWVLEQNSDLTAVTIKGA